MINAFIFPLITTNPASLRNYVSLNKMKIFNIHGSGLTFFLMHYLQSNVKFFKDVAVKSAIRNKLEFSDRCLNDLLFWNILISRDSESYIRREGTKSPNRCSIFLLNQPVYFSPSVNPRITFEIQLFCVLLDFGLTWRIKSWREKLKKGTSAVSQGDASLKQR